ncbi:hypothetical protein BGW38_007485, partial [Lunasporangiospora selenospora]
MLQRTSSFPSNNAGHLSDTPANAAYQNHHSPSSSLLSRVNTASRPGSPSGSVATTIGVSHHSANTSPHTNSNSSSGPSGLSGSYDPVSTKSEPFTDNSLDPMLDYSFSVGNKGALKRPRFGGVLAGSKKWKWWDYLVTMLLAFVVIEAIVLLVGSRYLYSLPDQIQIDSRDFRKVAYQGLIVDPAATYKKQIQVYHITKEFGPTSMGGLGMVVTALAVAQQRARAQKINVVLPYYSFLNQIKGLDIKNEVSLPIEVKDKYGRYQNVIFNVHKFKYAVPSKPSDYENDKRTITPVTVWLIGPGDAYPYSLAFQASSLNDIYSSPSGLPQEWKDLYFSKAAAAFIQHKNKNNDVSLFATTTTRVIDVVHAHGATNAMVLHYLQQSIDRRTMGEEPPALIYTLHDYLDELQHSYETVNVQKFMDRRVQSDDDEEDMYFQMNGISPYCHGYRMFTSALGIDLADAVTFVSKTLAKEIVEGRMDFHLKELVLGSILNQAEKNLFIGITNGIDFGRLNPWTMSQLRQHELAFPSTEDEGSSMSTEGDEGNGGAPTGMGSPNPTIRSAKEAAKHYLYTKGFLTEQDLSRPLVLYIGRFQYNKGLEFFATATSAITKMGGVFVIMGQPNNYPLSSLTNLGRMFKGSVRVISDAQTQDEWGVYWRTAADFVFVPSLTESFGLVAAEGLLFGSAVISSGVGGLSEFLIDRPSAAGSTYPVEDDLNAYLPLDQQVAVLPRGERFNSYLFDVYDTDAHSQLTTAINDAIQEWKRLQRVPEEHEKFLTRLVSSALALGSSQWTHRP